LLVLRLLMLLLLVGCRSTYYDEYRAAHPGWTAELPREGSGLVEVLAALHAPDAIPGVRVQLSALEIHRADVEPWKRIPFDALRSGAIRPEPTATYVVVADRSCRGEEGLRELNARRVVSYLLPDDRLAAWDHHDFRSRCSVTSRFRAARGEVASLELELAARIAAERGRPPLDLEQIYRRGLAYVEAGRLPEAQAMLLAGERGYRAAALQARARPERTEAWLEIARLRLRLMRALGVEEAPSGR
jgi:hypothetical protein